MRMNGKIAMLLMFCIASVFAFGTAAAVPSPDILIHPDVATINVPVDPNAVSPPLDIEYTDWGVSVATYSISVFRVSDGNVPAGCGTGGIISSNDLHVTMGSCKIPAADIGVAYKVVAGAVCPSCAPFSRSRLLVADANINPVPELPTGILASVGIIGLLGLVKYRKKNN